MTTRSRDSKALASLALAAMTCVGPVSCGGGDGGISRPASGSDGDEMMILPRTDNRTPVAELTFADIRMTLGDGDPAQWASGDLDDNFSDPDDDHLSYSVRSSNERIAGAVISEPGPVLTVQAQGVGGATISITARDPGGLTATQKFRVTVTDAPDHSDTPTGATAIALSESFQGRIDSPDDEDYFRLRVDSPGMLTIRTTGNADPDIAVFDGAGMEVPGVSGSWIGSITQEILDRGNDLLVRFSGGNVGGEYTGSTTFDQPLQTSLELSVGPPSVSDSSLETGGAFTLSATVSNQGDGESAATTLRYYRSTDATITFSDTEVGTDAVEGLAAGGISGESVELTAPSTAGTYYYGACVDPVTGELDTANNCSSSVTVTVLAVRQQAQGLPDSVVRSPSVNPDSCGPGTGFTLSVTVHNTGDGEFPATTTLRYYRSADATITFSDTEVGTDVVEGLAAGGTSGESVELTAPSISGKYYYGACVDAVAGEPDTTNNCSASVLFNVLESRGAKDDPDGTRSGAVILGDITENSSSFGENGRFGSIGGPGDRVDYFRFALSEEKSVDVALRAVHRQETRTDLFLEDADGGVLHQNTESAVALRLPATLQAGTYYVRLEDDSNCLSIYVFSYVVSQ